MFRKKKHNYKLTASASPLYELTTKVVSESDEEGNITNRVVYEQVDINDPNRVANIPSQDDYTLKKLIAAGVPLDYCNTKILDKTDPADLEEVGVNLGFNVVSDIEESEAHATVDDEPLNTVIENES